MPKPSVLPIVGPGLALPTLSPAPPERLSREREGEMGGCAREAYDALGDVGVRVFFTTSGAGTIAGTAVCSAGARGDSGTQRSGSTVAFCDEDGSEEDEDVTLAVRGRGVRLGREVLPLVPLVPLLAVVTPEPRNQEISSAQSLCKSSSSR